MMYFQLVWRFLTLFVFWKTATSTDFGYVTPIWSPQTDVCKPGPAGRIPWILHVRDSDYGWREHTHRAMIAVVVSGEYVDEDDMKKMQLQLEVELTRALFRNKTHPIDDGDLALYIHALLATNRNPRNFHGTDLVADLLQRVDNAAGQVNPFLVLALCNSHAVTYRHLVKIKDIAKYNHIVQPNNLLDVHPDVDSRIVQKKALAFKAFACAATYQSQLHKFSQEMTSITECLHRKYDEETGSFGNVYTTSLAVQAFTAANDSPLWYDKRKSVAYLEGEAFKDVNLIKAYYIEMALNAHKYKFIRELYDGVPLPGVAVGQLDMQYVQYTIKKARWPDMYFSMTLKVQKGTNFYDVMKIAANTSAIFNFTTYQSNHGEPMVYAVSGVPNDVEENVFWRLCRETKVNHTSHTSLIHTFHESPVRLTPLEGEHMTYLYSNADCPSNYLRRV